MRWPGGTVCLGGSIEVERSGVEGQERNLIGCLGSWPVSWRIGALAAGGPCGSAPHAWQIQKNSTTSTRRSPNSRRLMRLCSRRSFRASCLWVSPAFSRNFTRASRTCSPCWEWMSCSCPHVASRILLLPKCGQGYLVTSWAAWGRSDGLRWPHRYQAPQRCLRVRD